MRGIKKVASLAYGDGCHSATRLDRPELSGENTSDMEWHYYGIIQLTSRMPRLGA